MFVYEMYREWAGSSNVKSKNSQWWYGEVHNMAKRKGGYEQLDCGILGNTRNRRFAESVMDSGLDCDGNRNYCIENAEKFLRW